MAIEYQQKRALFDAVVSVEEAETLLEWVQQHPQGKADLSACTHVHAAVLQVLMAARMAVVAWPHDDKLNAWLRAALAT